MPVIGPRELVEIRNQWVCSECESQFYNLGYTLTGLTLDDIIQHLRKTREKAFADHVCLSYPHKRNVHN